MANRQIQVNLSKFGFKSPVFVEQSKKRKESKERYEINKRKRSFQDAWLNAFPGLKDTDSGMICDICTVYGGGHSESNFVKGCKSYRIDSLKSHWESPKHIACLAAQRVRDEGQGPLDIIIEKIGDANKDILYKLFNTAYAVMKYELPLTTYPVMLEVQVKNNSSIKKINSYGTDKACARFAPFIAQSIKEPLKQGVDRCRVMSVMFDGATDSSVTEVELVYLRFLQNGYPRDVLVALEELEHAHADGTFGAIDRAMKGFVGDDWLEKVVAIGSDGASVNLGANNSVRTRFQDTRPFILPVHCVAHRLELGVLDSIKNNNMMDTVSDLLKKLYKHYHFSPKSLRELREIADLMDEKIIKPTRLQGTRWVPHVQKASKALIKNFQVLMAHFEHVSQGGAGTATAEVKGRATFIVRKFKDFRVLRFIFFLQDLLDIISVLSLRFQADGATCIDFLDALEGAILSLTELKTIPGTNYASFLTEVRNGQAGTYKGTVLDHYDPDYPYDFADNVCELVIRHISARLENNNDAATNILQAGRIFDLRDWPRTREELANFGNDSLQILSDHYHEVLERVGCNIAELRNEWILLKAHFGQRIVQNNMPQINTLFLQQNPRLANILKLIEIILVLPVSTAICERGFSTVKRIKSDWRSRLTTAMMNHLLWISVEGPTLDAYQAERAVHLWWVGGQRARRPQFQLPQFPGDGDHVVLDEDHDELLQYLMAHNQE